MSTQTPTTTYGLRRGAEEFPLMVVISIIYPCNFGCPNCPYTDANSEIRRFYHERDGDLFKEELWNRIAVECGQYGAWMRCTGGAWRSRPDSMPGCAIFLSSRFPWSAITAFTRTICIPLSSAWKRSPPIATPS